MELEYPFKIALYLFVIVVVLSLLITFRSKFMKICFLPPCDEEKTCNNKPAKIEEEFTNAVIDKYSGLCYEKSKECKEDIFCYIISSEAATNPSALSPSCRNNDKCEITCARETTIVYIIYRWVDDKIEIGC
ncbi:MAG: hypothetical protein QXM38_01345 [Candidatus Aenigmatarchaeota archaeon]